MTKRRFHWAGPLVVILIAGCGSSNPNAPASITGKVTYKNAPVTAGNIKFHAPDAGVYPTGINPDGTYSISDIPAGDLVVTIETESVNLKKQSYGGGQGKDKQFSPMPEGANVVAQGAYVKIPAKYSDKTKSDLKVTLKHGKQEKDFDLTD